MPRYSFNILSFSLSRKQVVHLSIPNCGIYPSSPRARARGGGGPNNELRSHFSLAISNSNHSRGFELSRVKGNRVRHFEAEEKTTIIEITDEVLQERGHEVKAPVEVESGVRRLLDCRTWRQYSCRNISL